MKVMKKWSVLGLEQVNQNPSYKKAYNDKMKGFQINKVQTADRMVLLGAPQIMDADSLRRMSVGERDALMASLGVDALVEVQVYIKFATKGVAVMGIGSRYPQAYVSFRLYKTAAEKPEHRQRNWHSKRHQKTCTAFAPMLLARHGPASDTGHQLKPIPFRSVITAAPAADQSRQPTGKTQ